MQPNYDDSRTVSDAGFSLIPLHRYDAMVSVKGKSKQAGKRPLDNKWTTKLYTNAEVLAEAEKHGRNLGVRLTATQLVVDVDPRNFGLNDEAKERLKEPEIKATLDKNGKPTAATKALMGASWVEHTLTSKGNPLERLLDDCSMDLADYPRVETGSGGYHIYMAKPATLSVKDSLPEYPGIEYKSLGRQVVAPGSIHPDTGRHYVAVQDAFGDFKALPELAPGLSERIGRSRTNQDWSERARRATDGSREDARTRIDAGQIAELLPWVSIPSGHGDYLDWVMFLMAAHFAASGDIDVLAELEGWVDADAEIQDRWCGFGQYDGTPVTFGTLAKLALQYCLPGNKADVEAWIVKVRAASDFALLDFETSELDKMIANDVFSGNADQEAPLASKNITVLAQAFLNAQPYKLLRVQGRWLEYDKQKGCYAVLPPGDEYIEGEIWKFLHGRKYIAGTGLKIIEENAALVTNVKKAAMAHSAGPKELPAWNYSGSAALPLPSVLMPVSNGLLHLPTRRLLPATPMFVNVNVSAVHYDADATCPTWLRAVDQWFTPEQGPNVGVRDTEAIELLQEYLGYCLTQDISQQKFLYVMGPTRSGKSTLLTTLSMLLGDGNCKGAEEDSFTDTFGLELYEDAQVITFGDFRNSNTKTMSRLVSQILKIVGGDKVPVNRKNEKVVDKVLPARLVFASNLLPRFNDSAGAVAGRMLLLQYPNSYLGREDKLLPMKLKAEMAGILNWALDGLDRLKKRGSFVQPRSAAPLFKNVRVRTMPTKTFVEDQMVVDANSVLPKDEVFMAFEAWLEGFSTTVAVHYDHFFSQLYDNYPDVVTTKPRVNGEQVPSIRGLAWKGPFD